MEKWLEPAQLGQAGDWQAEWLDEVQGERAGEAQAPGGPVGMGRL